MCLCRLGRGLTASLAAPSGPDRRHRACTADSSCPCAADGGTVDVLHFFDTLCPVAEQVIEVPKIILKNIPSRRLARDPQLAEQLVERIRRFKASLSELTVHQMAWIAAPAADDGNIFREDEEKIWTRLDTGQWKLLCTDLVVDQPWS